MIATEERVRSARCETCDAQRRFTKRTPNHALHIALTLLTAGVWFLPYLIISFSAPRYFTCVECGSPLLAGWERRLRDWDARERAKVKQPLGELWRGSIREGRERQEARRAGKRRRER